MPRLITESVFDGQGEKTEVFVTVSTFVRNYRHYSAKSTIICYP